MIQRVHSVPKPLTFLKKQNIEYTNEKLEQHDFMECANHFIFHFTCLR